MSTGSSKASARLSLNAAIIGIYLSLQATPPAAQPAAENPRPERSRPVLLEEVIVTAQKREELEQDVPVAVTAMNADALRDTGLQTIPQLTNLHPSVYFDTAQSFQRNSLKIRGIGTIGNSRSFEGAVGVFVDGVYRPRTGMVLHDLLDVESMQVLRGPQGTLFGKNTVAGAIALMSSAPTLNDLSGEIEIRGGNFDSRYLGGSVNIPMGDSSALRLAGQLNERDGFFESPDNGDQYDTTDRYGFKAQLLFSPSDDLSVRIIADTSESDSHCCWGSAIAVNGPTAPLIDTYGAINGLTFVPAPDAERDRLVSLNTLPAEKVEDHGLTAIVEWNSGNVAFTSITGLRDWRHEQIDADADFSPADLFVLGEPAEIDLFSQEFNASLEIGPSDLLVGLYFASEDYESLRTVDTGSDADNYLNALVSSAEGAVACLPPLFTLDCVFPSGIGALLPDGEFTRERYWQDSESSALFAHASTELSERFTLVTGLRYAVDDKRGGVDNQFWYDSAIVRAVLAAAGVPDDGTPRNGLDLTGTLYGPSFSDDVRDEETTGVVSLQYFADENLMLYAGYHRGYKAGGVNLFREGAITDTTYRPESAKSIELGLKSTYWGGRARTNVAIFDTEFSDLQINFFTGLEFRTENTGKAGTRGLEIENQFRLTEHLQLDLSATHLDSAFEDLEPESLSYLDNRDTPRSPDWAAVSTLSYEAPLRNGLTVFTRAMASYTGDHYTGADVAVEEKSASYVVTDLSVGFRGRNERWEALLWCTNCGDETYRTIYYNSVFQPGSYSSFLNPPRQVGFTIRSRFSE